MTWTGELSSGTSYADGGKITAQSGMNWVSQHLTANYLRSSQHFNISDYKRTYVVFKKLPQLERKIELEKNG